MFLNVVTELRDQVCFGTNVVTELRDQVCF